MLESITVNYNAPNFFGFNELRSDTQCAPWPSDVDKALNAVKKGDVYVHFQYADGQRDCVYMDELDKLDGTWTLVHWKAPNSQDAPVRIPRREARKRIRKAISEEVT